MNLAELKKKNESEPVSVAVEPKVDPIVEIEIDPEVTPEVDPVIEPELDEDGNPIVEEVPAWMLEEEADPQISAETVPLSALMKQKHKGREKDAEIEELKKQLTEQRQAPQGQQPAERPKMPRDKDFDTDDDFEAAMEQFHYDVANFNASASSTSMVAQQQETARVQARDTAVNGFIERADAVVVKHKIKPEIYKGALDNVQGIIENAFQHLGGNAFPEFLSKLEDGDETTLYQIGRNKGQQDKLASLLRDDPSGIKAFQHIARLTGKNLGAKTKTSLAPKPAAKAKGDTNAVPANETAWRKKYDKAAEGQERYNVKQAAKAAGVKL